MVANNFEPFDCRTFAVLAVTLEVCPIHRRDGWHQSQNYPGAGGEGETESGMSRQHFPTAIVGPNPLLRESLSRFLQKSAFNIVGLASCIDELVPTTLPQDRAVLLIFDSCDHPGDACAQIERFRQDHPVGRIVVLANHCAPADIIRVLRSGANGYFATIATCDDFIKSLELVMVGQTILPSEGISSVLVRETTGACDVIGRSDNAQFEVPVLIDSKDMPQFSAREHYILWCLTEGSSNKMIARECDIAEGTVKVHVKAILRKIRVNNRTQAAIWALNNRSLVWPSEDGPCGDMVAGRPVTNVKLGAQNIGSTMRAPISDQIEGTIHDKAQQIRCIAGTDITPQVGESDGAG